MNLTKKIKKKYVNIKFVLCLLGMFGKRTAHALPDLPPNEDQVEKLDLRRPEQREQTRILEESIKINNEIVDSVGRGMGGCFMNTTELSNIGHEARRIANSIRKKNGTKYCDLEILKNELIVKNVQEVLVNRQNYLTTTKSFIFSLLTGLNLENTLNDQTAKSLTKYTNSLIALNDMSDDIHRTIGRTINELELRSDTSIPETFDFITNNLPKNNFGIPFSKQGMKLCQSFSRNNLDAAINPYGLTLKQRVELLKANVRISKAFLTDVCNQFYGEQFRMKIVSKVKKIAPTFLKNDEVVENLLTGYNNDLPEVLINKADASLPLLKFFHKNKVVIKVLTCFAAFFTIFKILQKRKQNSKKKLEF